MNSQLQIHPPEVETQLYEAGVPHLDAPKPPDSDGPPRWIEFAAPFWIAARPIRNSEIEEFLPDRERIPPD